MRVDENVLKKNISGFYKRILESEREILYPNYCYTLDNLFPLNNTTFEFFYISN